MKILVSGSLAYDRIMDFPEKFSDHILPDKIHILNVCFLVNGLKEQFGGTAGNISYNLALLGERPLILAAAGKDFENYGKWLSSLGLPLDGIRCIDDEFTAGAYITTDKSDNQITGFNPGAMKYPCNYATDGLEPHNTIAIIAPGNVDDMTAYSMAYKERSIPYIFDPGQQIPVIKTDLLIEMLSGSRLFISNDYELEMIMRSTGLAKSDLLEKTQAIVTTLGERGSVVCTHEGETPVPIARASGVLDPTGAGDAFRAGLIKGMIVGKTILDAAKMGAVSSSFSVQCQGTQCHRFTLDEFGPDTKPILVTAISVSHLRKSGAIAMIPTTHLELAPGQVFREIREVFTDLGLLGSMISVEYEGAWYRISCDDTAFMVYRVNERQRVRHHLPGWPVCLVNSHIIFEESGHPAIGQDHCACGVELDRWLEIVNEYCIGNLSERFQE